MQNNFNDTPIPILFYLIPDIIMLRAVGCMGRFYFTRPFGGAVFWAENPLARIGTGVDALKVFLIA